MALTRRLWPDRVARSVGLSWLGLWVEQGARVWWPLWCWGALGGGLWLFGLRGPLWPWVVVAAVLALGGLWFLRRPRWAEAEARVDARLPGRPLAALRDQRALGDADLWQAHRSRMARAAQGARPVAPDLRLAALDPGALRLSATAFLAVALLFGPKGAGGGAPQPAPAANSWEAWAEPPRHTGRPSLYLNDVPDGALRLPQGTTLIWRSYGSGAHQLRHSLSPEGLAEVQRSGVLQVIGPQPRRWQVTMLPDAPPQVALDGPATLKKGETVLTYTASDDYGLVKGHAEIALDLDRVPRQHGLATVPDDHPILALDLTLPQVGDRTDITGALRADLAKHLFANMPVQMRLFVSDGLGQEQGSAPMAMTLSAPAFYEPSARALAEQRRDLLWARANGPRVAQVLRAIAWHSEALFPKPAHGAALRSLIDRLETAPQDDAVIEEVAEGLWLLATELDEGALGNARARLKRAQERLAEAMRNGADPDDIARLMDELRAAKNDYMRLLAEEAGPAEPDTDQPDQPDDSRTVTQDEIDALMDEIQRLMQEGKMDEAEALMEQLNALLDALRVEQGQGGGDGPGQQSLDQLGETLRDQQELSDEIFRELQDRFNGRAPEPEGQTPGEAPGQEGDTGASADRPSVADRQEALRQELRRQQQALPGVPGDQAEAARDALRKAEEAMDRAEEALRRDDLPGAIDEQARALEALRRGLRLWREALRREADTDEQGEEATPEPSERDPLGRSQSQGEDPGGETALPSGPGAKGAARALQDELRRRLSDRQREAEERRYLERLLSPD